MTHKSRALALFGLLFIVGCSASRSTGDSSTTDSAVSRDAAMDTGCQSGASLCGTACADLQADPHHCGSCATDCTTLANVDPASARCTAGHCDLTASCAHGFAHCSTDPSTGCESDLSQPAHCGACGVTCADPMPMCTTDTSGTHCASGCSGATSTRCGRSCVNTMTDTQHCGTCSTVCPDPSNGHGTCSAGHCGLSCNTGFHACGGDCVGDHDTTACGPSCTPCATPPHAIPTCDTGTCSFRCDTGFGNCDGNAANGCETDTRTDVNHCSSCSTACSTLNTTSSCVMGACTITSCAAGFADCNTMAVDGCEASTASSPANCGACGHTCSVTGGTASCVAGMCGVSGCTPGFSDCDSNAANGCETNTGTDAMNCGACGQRCSIPNGVASCVLGACAVGACNAGFADCDGNPTNGCETNTAIDPMQCGACGNRCLIANGSGGCAAGTCTVAACNAGFGDCDGDPATGCETNTSADSSNCGACGNNCATACGGAPATCGGSRCGITSCPAGAFDLDGACANGCECVSTGSSTMCVGATMLGTLNIGQAATYSGNLVPAGQEAYLTVFFQGNTSLLYHPHVVMTAGASEFTFDILTNCSGTLIACGTEGGTAGHVAEWETSYTAGDPASGGFVPIPAVGTGGTIIIHVSRRSGLPVTCNEFTLRMTN